MATIQNINHVTFTLFNYKKEIILSNVLKCEIKKLARKRFYLSSKYIWRKTLIENGYNIIKHGNYNK